MPGNVIKELSIDQLLLDSRNPRHDTQANDEDAMREMVKGNEGDKLLRLAEDIVTNGMNPSEMTMIIPKEGTIDKYIVVEGNRRLAALKLLINPSSPALAQRPSLRRRFDELSREFSKQKIDRLLCVFFEQRPDTDHWVELKHTGENDGVGVVSWNADQIARFRARLGKHSFALRVLEFVSENAALDDVTKANLPNMPITNLDRLVTDPYVRDKLGIRLENNELRTELPKQEVLKGLTKVVKDVTNKTITVNDIRFKGDRQKYIDSFSADQLPNAAAPAGPTWSVQPSSAPVAPTVPRRRSLPLSTRRKMLIPSTCKLKIAHARINHIYKELTNLDIDRFTNCGAVMFRVFLELSIDEYIAKEKVTLPKPSKGGDISLAKKMQTVAKYMEDNNVLKRDELKEVRIATSNPDSLFSPNTLNAYVHNPHFSPKSMDLKTSWDNMQLFVEKLWG